MSEPDQSQSREGEHRKKFGGWMGALVLIAIGVVLLLQNLGYSLPRNWWAIFLLIPAFYSLAGAWRSYEHNGSQVTMGTIGPLIGGLVLLALGIVFLFDVNLNWGIVLPIVLILLGVGALVQAYYRS
jgi:hypothetical protein